MKTEEEDTERVHQQAITGTKEPDTRLERNLRLGLD